jgi:hypothetical protein
MASTIKLKNGSGEPLATDLVTAEPAFDLTNKRLYTEDSGGTVIEVGTNPTEIQIDNINIDGNTISSTDTNGDITLDPSGTGGINLSADVDVTGTVTADGLTVDGAVDTSAIQINTAYGSSGEKYSAIRWNNTSFAGGDSEIRNVVNGAGSVGASFEFYTDQTGTGTLTERMKLHNNGDIAFYEDTGTTAKFFWDASAERLGIGTSSPQLPLHVYGGFPNAVIQRNAGATAASGLVLTNTTNNGFYITGSDQAFTIGDVTSYNSSGTFTERMRIDSSGNVGIGTTPESWVTGYAGNVLQVGDAAVFGGSTNDSMSYMLANAYYDSSNSRWEYINTDFATRYEQLDGQHLFYTAASGTADAAITWSQAMTLDASGNLLVGTTDGSGFTTSSTNSGVKISDGIIAVNGAGGSTAAGYFNVFDDGTILDFRKDGASVGSIGSRNGTSMTLSSSGSVNMYDTSTSAGGIAVSSSVVYPINNTGATTDNLMDLGSSSVRFKDLYLSGGVVFGDAGGSGTPTSNTLDSYEEGTFDPTVGGVDSGNGFYRKIGDLIFIEIVLTANSISTDTIGGLPFNISSASGYGGLLFGRMTNCDVLDSNGVPCRMNFSFATIEFRQNSLNASDGSFTITSPASGTVRIGISGVGRVT